LNSIKAVMDKGGHLGLNMVQLDYHHVEGTLAGLTLASALPVEKCPPLTELVKGRRVLITYKGDYTGPGSELDRIELDDSPRSRIELTDTEKTLVIEHVENCESCAIWALSVKNDPEHIKWRCA
jgi:hypothetical protein